MRTTMDELHFIIRYGVASLLLVSFASSLEISNNGDNSPSISETRHPRVNGRIVKLYSGTRPDPIICSKEGFHPDPEDCNVFYRCMKTNRGKFSVQKFRCGPGSIYDTEKEICNHPKATSRTDCGGRAMGRSNENDIFDSLPEVPSPIASLPALVELQRVLSTSSWFSRTERSPQAFRPSTINPLNKSYPLPKETSIMSRPTSQHGEPCKSDGFMGDSQNCRKFYRCVGNGRGGFIRYEFSCSETTIWDDEMQSCNHDWAVKRSSCGARGLTSGSHSNFIKIKAEESKVNEVTTQQQRQISYGSIVNQVQNQISHKTAIQNKTQEHHSNKIDNKKSQVNQNQTQISYGAAVSQTQTQINNGDKSTQTQSQIDHSNQSSQSQSLETSNTDTQNDDLEPGYNKPDETSSDSSSTVENDNTCTESGFMGDSSNCKKFYRCVDNGKGYTKYEFTCGEGTVWDPDIEGCNHAWAVKSCGSKDPNTNQVATTTTVRTTQIIQNPTTTVDDQVGYGTQNQPQETTTRKQVQTTEWEQGYGNQNQNEETSQSSQPSDNRDSCQSSGFMSDPNDCSKFYRCVDNGGGSFTKYEFKCGEGTVWDSSIEACNHAWAVKKCGGSSEIETTSHSQTMTTVLLVQTTTQKSPQNDDYDSGYGHQQIDVDQTTTSTSKPTTSTSGTSQVCTSDGFMGDPNDCKKFYRCVDNGNGSFTLYEFTCGEGTVWDPEINACNHAGAVKKCGGSNNNNQASAQTTTEGTQNTDQPEQEQTTSSKPSSTTKPASSKECTQEGFMGDDADCKKFYRCVDNGHGGFIKYEFVCGEGTQWDQEIQGCNHETKNKKCGSGDTNIPENPPPVQSDEMPETTATQTSTSTEKVSTTSKPVSTDKCEAEGFYADKNDCRKFYRCVDNGKGSYTKYEFTCGEGTIWVQEIQACDHDTDNQCKAQSESSSDSNYQQSSETTSSTTTTQPGEQSTENNQSSSSSTTQSPPSEDVCSAEGFYGDQNDCKRFYRCVSNGQGGYTKYDFTCAEGTAWDTDSSTCNYISEVKRCNNSGQTTKPTSQSNEPTSQTKPVMQDEEQSQTTQAQSGSTTTTEKTTSTTSSGSQQSSSNDKCEKEGYYGNSKDCTKFYRCVDNGNGGLTKYDFDCGEGTIWDQDVQTCNHPQDVANPSCNQSDGGTTSSSSSSSSTTQSSGSSSSTTTTEKSDQGSDCSQDQTTKKPSNKNVNCTNAGFYADPDDCKKFYRCVDWDGNGQKFSVFHFDCGEGTIWDPAVETCNYEDSVYPPRDCSQSQSQNVSQESTTTEGTTTEGNTDSTTDSTTQSSTTGSSTTQKSTTQKSTTQSSTTQKSTTQKSTTQSSTTSSTTQKSTTTTKSTTSQQTTQEQTTEQQSTTEQSTTTEQQTTQESTTQGDQTTESQTDSTTTESDQDSTTQSSSDSDCPEHDDDQNVFVCPTSFRRHPKYCNLFYQCTEDEDTHDVKIATFHCPNNTIYDESKTQCVEEKKADKKCDGSIAQRRRLKRLSVDYQEPIVVSRDKHSCPAVGHFPFERKDSCSPSFMKCQKSSSGKIRGYVYQCPERYVYWTVSRRCELKGNVKECQNAKSSWTRRFEIPTERDNVGRASIH